MLIDCTVCVGGVASDDSACNICGGDGKLDLIDDHFPQHIQRWKLHGMVWDALLTALSTLTDKVDALDTKMDTLDSYLDTIETKIDALNE